jgi:hypothetical protein
VVLHNDRNTVEAGIVGAEIAVGKVGIVEPCRAHLVAVSENRETQSAIDREVNVECVSGRDVAGAEHFSEYRFSIGVKARLAKEVPSKSDRSDWSER